MCTETKKRWNVTFCRFYLGVAATGNRHISMYESPYLTVLELNDFTPACNPQLVPNWRYYYVNVNNC